MKKRKKMKKKMMMKYQDEPDGEARGSLSLLFHPFDHGLLETLGGQPHQLLEMSLDLSCDHHHHPPRSKHQLHMMKKEEKEMKKMRGRYIWRGNRCC